MWVSIKGLMFSVKECQAYFYVKIKMYETDLEIPGSLFACFKTQKMNTYRKSQCETQKYGPKVQKQNILYAPKWPVKYWKESHSGACTFFRCIFLRFNINAFPSEKNEDQITGSFVKKLALGHNNGPIFISTYFKVKFGLTKFHFPAVQTLNLLALTTGFPGAVLVASHCI